MITTPLAFEFYRRIVKLEQVERQADEESSQWEARLESMTDEQRMVELDRVTKENEAWFADFHVRMRRQLWLLAAVLVAGISLIVLTYIFRDALP